MEIQGQYVDLGVAIPDPTPDYGVICKAMSPSLTFTCTMPQGHEGQGHVAGNGEGAIAAIWW